MLPCDVSSEAGWNYDSTCWGGAYFLVTRFYLYNDGFHTYIASLCVERGLVDSSDRVHWDLFTGTKVTRRLPVCWKRNEKNVSNIGRRNTTTPRARKGHPSFGVVFMSMVIDAVTTLLKLFYIPVVQKIMSLCIFSTVLPYIYQLFLYADYYLDISLSVAPTTWCVRSSFKWNYWILNPMYGMQIVGSITWNQMISIKENGV